MLRFLVVEDEAIVAAALARTLARSSRGKVDVARSVEAGLRAADAPGYDGALVDVRLPDGSGLAVVRRLREVRAMTRIVVMTGFATREIANATHMLGASFLWKPIDPEDLRAFVASMAIAAATPISLGEAHDAIRAAHELSPQQSRFLASAVGGASIREIARAENLKPSSAKTQVRRLLKKCGCSTMRELVLHVHDVAAGREDP